MTGPVIGVDLGGTKVAAAPLIDGSLSEATVQTTRHSDSDRLIDQLVELVQSLQVDGLTAVGVGVPSVVEFETGRVVSSVNVPLADVPLRAVLGDRLGVPVYVDNDATVAALAEAHDEQLRLVSRNLVILTVGTGLGGGIVIGGRIYRGAMGGAGELGHTLVGLQIATSVPAPTRFPQPGSLESFAAGTALDALAAELAASEPDSELGTLLAEGGSVLGPDVVRVALNGDDHAQKVVELWGERLGIGVANVINTFDPDEVVIGGGAAQVGDMLLRPAERVARGYALPGVGARTTIRLARHGVRAGVLGAALLAIHEQEGVE